MRWARLLDPHPWRWARLVSVPRVPVDRDPHSWMVGSITAAITAAHAVLLPMGRGVPPQGSGSARDDGSGSGGRPGPGSRSGTGDRSGPEGGPGPGGGPGPDDRAALAVSWVRPPGSHLIHVLLGGRPLLPLVAEPRPSGGPPASSSPPPATSTARGPTSLLWPPGASAEPVPAAVVRSRWDGLSHWARCLGAAPVDVVRPGQATGGEDVGGLGWDDYLMHLPGPFAWLVVAEPLPVAAVDEEIARLTAELTLVRRRESEPYQVDLERGQRRHRELVRARSDGWWRVHVLAGGVTARDAHRAAALLSGACHPGRTGQQLVPGPVLGRLEAAWGGSPTGPEGARSPFDAGAQVVASLLRPPLREQPGLHLVAAPGFDVTPQLQGGGGRLGSPDAGAGYSWRSGSAGGQPDPVSGRPDPASEAVPAGEAVAATEAVAAAVLGDVLDEAMRPVGPFAVSHETLNRHGFVCGATGSGKSQTARRLLESLATGPARVPWLVVEPAKAEYAGMSGRLGPGESVLVIRPGDLHAPPASLNPLAPQPGFPLQSHADLVRALFLAAFEAHEPFPQVLAQALTRCYVEAGWDLVTGGLREPITPKLHVDEPDRPASARYPTLRDLQATARQVVGSIGYGAEVTADVRGFVDVRIGSLRQGTPGRLFDGGHPLDVPGLLRRHAVLELDAVTSDQDKAFVIGAVLINVVEHLRVGHQRDQGGSGRSGLRHVLLVEEAHRLLRNLTEGPAAAAVELFASLLAEIRAYGEGVVVVEQIPSKIIPDVVKNTAVKVVHRLPAEDDRSVVGATMNLQPDQSEAVVALDPGVAAVATDGADRPLLVRVPGGMGREDASACDTVPPLAGRRSPLCAGECLSRACTLAEIAAAERAADRPLVVIWAETVAAALVVGPPIEIPRPRSQVLRSWPGDPRTRQCAVATLADRATDARRAHLLGRVDAADFAAHLAATLTALLDGTPLPAGDRRRWRAGPYRWREAHLALRAAVDRAGGLEQARSQPPHPDTAAWERVGLVLDEADLAGQFELLLRDPAYADGARQAVVGDTETSGLRRAVLAVRGSTSTDAVATAVRLAARGESLAQLVAHMHDLVAEPGRAGRGEGST